MSSASSSGATASVTFPVSPVPRNSLGEGNYIRTAGALIIGYIPYLSLLSSVFIVINSDEILNGKTLDRNSHFFAKYCFEHGVELYVLCLPRGADGF
jgi:hypothetical protein